MGPFWELIMYAHDNGLPCCTGFATWLPLETKITYKVLYEMQKLSRELKIQSKVYCFSAQKHNIKKASTYKKDVPFWTGTGLYIFKYFLSKDGDMAGAVARSVPSNHKSPVSNPSLAECWTCVTFFLPNLIHLSTLSRLVKWVPASARG